MQRGKWINISHFPHSCNQIPKRNQIKEGKIYPGSQVKKGLNVSQEERHDNWSHCVPKMEAESRQEVTPGCQNSRPVPSGLLNPTRLQQPPKCQHHLGTQRSNSWTYDGQIHIQTTVAQEELNCWFVMIKQHACHVMSLTVITHYLLGSWIHNSIPASFGRW